LAVVIAGEDVKSRRGRVVSSSVLVPIVIPVPPGKSEIDTNILPHWYQDLGADDVLVLHVGCYGLDADFQDWRGGNGWGKRGSSHG